MDRPLEGNPLLDAWRGALGDGAPYPWHGRRMSMESHRLRWELSARYAFAVPTDEALDLVAEAGPVVEVGAGTGYWAALLRARGCDVVAYDLLGESYRRWFPDGGFGGVERGAAFRAADHPDRTLLLVWPPYADPMASQALRAYGGAGGRRVVYVGEGPQGCCGDDGFFSALEGPEWQELKSVAIPQWDGLNDWLWVYGRRP